MASLIADIIEGVRWQEEDGTVTAIDRAFMVTDITAPGAADVPDHGGGLGPPLGFPTRDEVMRYALDNSDLPAPGRPHPIESHLFVTKRVPKIIGPRTVMVTVTYAIPGGGSFDPPFGDFALSGGSSVEQVERALHNQTQPDGATSGQQIVVEYQPPGADTAIKQNGEITPFEGRAVMSFRAQIATQAPWAIVSSWVNMVNTGSFFPYAPGAASRTWLITDMDYELLSSSNPLGAPLYEMTLTMRHNPNTWDPFVIYIDPETGRPPADLLNVGYKTVKWHFEDDFGRLFTAGL